MNLLNCHLVIAQQEKVVANQRGLGRILTVFFCNKHCRIAWKQEPVTSEVRPMLNATVTEMRLSNYYQDRIQQKLLAKTLINVLARGVQSRSYWRVWSQSMLRSSSYALPKESEILDNMDKQMVGALETLVNSIDMENNKQEFDMEKVTPHDKNAECDHCSGFSDCE